MRHAILVLIVLGLAGCSVTNDLFQSGSATDRIADRVIPAETPQERGLRACFMATGISELAAYRLTYFESTQVDRDMAALALGRLVDAVQVVRVSADVTWFNTSMFYVGADLIRAIQGPLTDQILDAVETALTGRVGDIVSALRVRAGQAALASLMVEDVRAYFALTPHDVAWLDLGWEICQERAQQNITKLGG